MNILTDNEVLQICKSYTNETVSFTLLGVSHNIVYRINSTTPFVLRITPLEHRELSDVLSEIEFVSFLYQNGANVNKPVLSLSGKAVEEYKPQTDKYYVTAFTFVEGLDWKDRGDDDLRMNFIGQELGRIHRLSKQYKTHNVVLRRDSINSQHLTKGFSIFKNYDIRVYDAYLKYIETIKALPKNRDNYGLTHGDFLFSNYNITQDNKVSIFDFDELEYSWFISDIAVCLYYYLLGGNPSELDLKKDEATNSFRLFMSGYMKENNISTKEFEYMDLFFKQRDFILLSTIIGRNESELNWWDDLFVKGAVDRILNNKPFIDVDFSKLIE